MKKVLIIIGLIVVAAAVAVGVFVMQGKKLSDIVQPFTKTATSAPKVTLANYVPDEAVAYLGVYGLQDTWNDFQKSNIWKKLSALPLWKDLDIKTGIATFQQEIKAQAGIEVNEKNIMELIGRQIAFAVFMNSSAQKTPSAVVLAQVGAKTRLLSAFIDLTKQGEGPYEKIKYKGVTVYHVKATEQSPTDMSIAVVKDILVIEIGLETKNINSIIDLVMKGGRGKSMAKNINFIQATDSKNGPYMQELFLDAKTIVADMDKIELPEALQDETIKEGIKNTLGTINLMGGSGKFSGGLYTKLIIIPNKDPKNKELTQLWNARPQKAKSLRYVPKETLLFNSSQSLDIPKLWSVWQDSIITQNAGTANEIITAVNSLETNLNISLKDDIFPVLGDEISYILTDVDMQGFIPIPKVAVMFNVKNKDSALVMMQKIIDSINSFASAGEPGALPLLTLEKTDYMGVPITVSKITSFPIPGLTPCYAVVDNELIITSNNSTLQDMIAVYQGKKDSIYKSANYAKVKKVFTDKNNQLSYIDLEKTLNKMVEVCRWLIDLQRSATQIGALTPQTVDLITNNLIPFIQSFNSLKVLAANTVYTNKGIEKVIVYKVEDL
ncbi:DUF3352 domain-containing protein [bacterium]|nr:DUF3352 domain-containing protein [bacterium]